MNLKVRRIYQVTVISIMISFLLLGSSNGLVFAQQTQTNLTPTQTTFFTHVSVDSSPIPNKPFKITASIETQNAGDLIASISAPVGVSVVTPVVANPGYTASQNTITASWTLIAGQPGSYSITLLAHANFPVQDVTYVVNVNVGTPNSLVITGIKVPGNIFPNDIFTVSLSMKNVGLVDDSNVLTSISIPAGLQLISNVSENSTSMRVGEEKLFDWTLKAQTAGSYAISFFYSSTNSGSNSIDSTVNVGQLVISDISLSKVTWAGYNSTSFLVGPGDQFVPLIATLQNVGDLDLYNINAVLLLKKPFLSNSSGDTIYSSSNDNLSSTGPSNSGANFVQTKNYYIGHIGIGQS